MNRHDRNSGDPAPSSGSARPGSNSTSSDVLSHVLGLVRLKGERIYAADLRAPWNFAFKPGAGHFVFVQQGLLRIEPDGASSVEASSGDLLLLPHGTGHTLRDASSDRTAPSENIDIDAVEQGHLFLRNAGFGDSVSLVGGSFRFDGDSLPHVLGPLPRLLRVSKHDGHNAEWLEALSHFLLAEAHVPAPGATLMISRLIDVLIIRALRSWAETQTLNRGWLGGLGDPQIGRALLAMHEDPFHDWTVRDLAEIAAMSRSVFAQRFAARVGISPFRYLTNARLTKASDLLQTGTVSIGDVAHRVGYASEAAFSRAYKIRFGKSPSQVRPHP